MTPDDQIRSNLFHFISSRIDEISRQHEESPTLLLLKGFTSFQIRAALKANHISPSVSSLLNGQDELDVSRIEENRKGLIVSLLTLDQPLILLYEQVIPIRASLGDVFSGDIVIIKNNLFPDGSPIPSAVSQQELSHLAETIEDSKTDDDCALGKFYASVTPCKDSWLVTPIELDRSAIQYVEKPLFPSSAFEPSNTRPSYEQIKADSNDLIGLCLELSCGVIPNASIVVSRGTELATATASVLMRIASIAFHIEASIEFISETDIQPTGDGERLLSLLRKYWGADARYRKLQMYENPDIDNKMREFSQGEISDFAVEQAERALKGSNDYRDMFITAPTGAGKSLLFQLPALYLAEAHHAITLVIEPLKALMRDQVKSLQSRGVTNVVAINSDLTYGERQSTYERIRNGSASIVYLSPELLLGSSLDDILGGRRVALVVIDEVHTVTSWGKDFRPDYWYLGSYLAKIRKQGLDFPIFCMTATAVYGGKDDMVLQTVRDLELISPYILLGNPRRDDISFDIRHVLKSRYAGRIDEVKTELAVEAAKRFVECDSHSIIYCPYKSHVEAVTEAAAGSFPGSSKVLGFHGGMDKEYKKTIETAFKQRSCLVLVSTKAFGMGVDVDDITDVYHYAPTGNLCDYVQEIGRGARKASLKATASIDFFNSDSSYANQLYHLSRFYDWQLRDIMEKLYEVYSSRPQEQRSQNLLVSPNSFSYLFPDETDDTARVNRTKSALMMISKDLEERYGFPVLIVRPKPTFTKCFICIERNIERAFLSRYGQYVHRVSESKTRVENHRGQQSVYITDAGAIFELEAAKMWEEQFPQYSFLDFKRRLFKNELLDFGKEESISSRVKLEITYKEREEQTEAFFSAYAHALDSTFKELARDGSFDAKKFKSTFEQELGAGAPALSHAELLLRIFIHPADHSSYGMNRSSMKFVYKRSSGKQTGMTQATTYKLKYGDVLNLEADLMRRFSAVKPSSSKVFSSYINAQSAGKIYETAELLEVLGLANYEAHGGDEPEIFIRLNDPKKLHELAADVKFRNRVLREMTNRHKYASKVITGFFNKEMTDEARWDLIEEYFLGNDAKVAETLGITTQDAEPAETKVKYRGSAELFLGPTMVVVDRGTRYEGHFFRLWKELMASHASNVEFQALKLLKDAMRGSAYEHPLLGAKLALQDDNDSISPLLTWEHARVVLFDIAGSADYVRAGRSDWKCYLLGNMDADQLAANVRVSSLGH